MVRVRALRWLVVAVMAMTLSTAFAGHRANRDVRLGINGWTGGLLAGLLPISEVGDLAYDVQEGVHDAVTDVTGVEIDHSYIWIGVGGEEIPLDPFEFHR